MNDFRVFKLTQDDLIEFNQDNTLYVTDFRATGETLEHEIYAMYTYENLSQWLYNPQHKKGYFLVNNSELYQEIPNQHLVIAPIDDRIANCIIDRIDNISTEIKFLWTAIPHPAMDSYAKRNGLDINCSYVDFLKFNDKIAQKKLLLDYTPGYRIIKSEDDLRQIIDNGKGFIKSSIGAGGYSVYKVSDDVKKIQKYKTTILDSKFDWYFEEEVDGEPYSAQLYRDKNGVCTLFGYAKQYMDGTNYIGAELLSIQMLTGLNLDKIKTICSLIKPLIVDYSGFFGIDFMIDNGNIVGVLELNVRMTATTIPTLIANATRPHLKIEYFEDIQKEEMLENDICLVRSPDAKFINILRLKLKPYL